MITEIKGEPLAFEQVVREEVEAPLAERDFEWQPAFHLYKEAQITFERHRRGQRERVEFWRGLYDEADLADPSLTEDDEIDRMPDHPDGERYWASRHSLFVQLIVGEASTGYLHTDGSRYFREDRQRWDFGDEADLRKTLRDRIMPLLLTVGMEEFDESLEAALERAAHALTAA